jgi:hypothetical protein
MPMTCFSYPADVPPDAPGRGGPQPASPARCRMTNTTCFRYQAETDLDGARPVTPGPHRGTSTTCFRY